MRSGRVVHPAVRVGRMTPPGWETLATVDVRLDRNGDTKTATRPQAAEEVVEMVTVVADLLERFGERLQAGDTIITGALTRPLAVEPGDRVAASIDPLGALEINFEP